MAIFGSIERKVYHRNPHINYRKIGQRQINIAPQIRPGRDRAYQCQSKAAAVQRQIYIGSQNR